jgi:hypothetical protein
LKHIVHLKMLEAHPQHLVWMVEQAGTHTGVALLLPAWANPLEARMYPTADGKSGASLQFLPSAGVGWRKGWRRRPSARCWARERSSATRW